MEIASLFVPEVETPSYPVLQSKRLLIDPILLCLGIVRKAHGTVVQNTVPMFVSKFGIDTASINHEFLNNANKF